MYPSEGQDKSQMVEIDVILITMPNELREMLQKVAVSVTTKGEIILQDLLAKLKSLGFPLDIHMISYYSDVCQMFVYCGNEPLPRHLVIPKDEYINSMKICLKIRKITTSLF